MFSIMEFAKFLGEAAAEAEASAHKELDRAARAVQRRAKADIGHYQMNTGQFAPWAPLADSTVADKARQGFAPPDNPLLRTGEMRNSIERHVEEHEAVVGSNSEIAVFQELGTDRMPPRSFLGAAAFQEAEAVAAILGEGFMARVFPASHGTYQPPSGNAGAFEEEINAATRSAESGLADVAAAGAEEGIIGDVIGDALMFLK